MEHSIRIETNDAACSAIRERSEQRVFKQHALCSWVQFCDMHCVHGYNSVTCTVFMGTIL